ncbi:MULTISPECIES: MarR family winged helix-turn-helix transcriptional regulator [Streptomyces]|uniref:MarR family winged helix-turn-helix transcriptional regulator n=1 Tax=Streptomyces TaxID=1883 RepID=UPI0006AE4167|nr:MarR family winged helix-turn-helix transcriptional regulator [Streptomyces sp. AS58]
MSLDVNVIDEAETDPLNRLGFLLARHGASSNDQVRRAFTECGLGPRQGMTLMLLGQSGAVAQQALAAKLQIDASVVVGILNELESSQLVERRRDPSDRRRHIVDITDKGRDVLTKAREAVSDVERSLFGGLSQEEITVLRELLARIRTSPSDEACSE